MRSASADGVQLRGVVVRGRRVRAVGRVGDADLRRGATARVDRDAARLRHGRFTYYHDLTKVVADRVYDRWIRLNVVHDVAAGNVTVFVGGERRLEVQGHGGKEHYFKFGVYTQGLHKHSHRMEAHWKNTLDVLVSLLIWSCARQ